MNNKLIKKFFLISLVFVISQSSTLNPQLSYAAMPSSANYQLQEYSFGSGGEDNATSTNFKLNAVAGEVEFGQSSSSNYKAGTGLTYIMMANVPPAPTFTNPSSYYNKLKIVLATGSNPSDAQFAIAISPDNFSSTTKYVQADTTLGNSPVWQTYATWGGASGTNIIGLATGTTYTVKVAAKQGNFTESPYGPTSQAATITPTLSMSLSTNSVSIGSLTPGSVTTSGTQVTTTLSTNGTGGAVVYVNGANSGLLSSSTSYTISAVSSDLSGATEGYGLRAVSATQSSGGPMESISPYNGSGDNVGILNSTKRPLFDSSGSPVTSGQGVFELKAKASSLTKAATDYTDTLTIITSATF